MAAACFAAAAAGLLARAANFMADRWSHESTGVAVVRILATDAPDALATAEQAIAAAPHVARAQIVTAERAASMIEDWQSGEVRPSDLPPLQLVEVEFTMGAPANSAEQLQQHLLQRGLAADVVSPQNSQTVAARSARAIRLAAFVGAIVLALLMGAVIALSSRALALRHADLITALADMGATSSRAGQELGEMAMRTGLWAGVVGAVAAGLVAFAAIYMSSPTSTPLGIVTSAHPLDWAPMILTPPLAAVFANLGARAGAATLHARAARIV
jgi:cell division protein FtsX